MLVEKTLKNGVEKVNRAEILITYFLGIKAIYVVTKSAHGNTQPSKLFSMVYMSFCTLQECIRLHIY